MVCEFFISRKQISIPQDSTTSRWTSRQSSFLFPTKARSLRSLSPLRGSIFWAASCISFVAVFYKNYRCTPSVVSPFPKKSHAALVNESVTLRLAANLLATRALFQRGNTRNIFFIWLRQQWFAAYNIAIHKSRLRYFCCPKGYVHSGSHCHIKLLMKKRAETKVSVLCGIKKEITMRKYPEQNRAGYFPRARYNIFTRKNKSAIDKVPAGQYVKFI